MFAASLTLAAPAFAQSDAERAGARAVAMQGVQAFNEGRFKEAVDLFTRAESVVHSPIHLLYIARSHEKLGQLVPAYEAYRKIVREQQPADASEAVRNAQADAQKELTAIEPRLPYVNIVVEGAANATPTVTMDGATVPAALVGVSRPVDPGEHKFQAVADGMQSEIVTLAIKEGARETVTLKLVPSAVPAGAGNGSTQTGAQVAIGGTAEPGQDPGTSGPNKLRIGSYVAFGVGVLGLGAGTFFLIDGLGKRGDANDMCSLPGDNCPLEQRNKIDSLDDDANTSLTLSVVGYGVGVAGVAAGTVLFIMSNKQKTTAEQPSVRPWIAGDQIGIQGSFF